MESLPKLREWVSSLSLDNPQTLRLRRMGLALLGAAAFSFICMVLYSENIFRVSYSQFVYLLSIFWIVNLCFFVFMLTGLNKTLADPSLTTAQMFWAISTTMLLFFLYLLREK